MLNKIRSIIKIDIYIVAIILLSISQSFMHVNFLVGHEDIKIDRYKEQIAYAEGMITYEPHMQSRLLFPNMLKIVGQVMPQQILTERYHAGLSLAIAEWITIVFSLLGLFLLSNEILRSRLKSFLVVIAYSIYLPFIFQLTFRFGESFIFGFFCFLAYSVIAKRQMLFILLLLLCSIQRADVAFTSVFFKTAYEFFEYGKKYRSVFINLSLFIIPLLTIYGITNLYDLKTAHVFFARTPELIWTNLRYLPVLFFCYLPVFILSAIRLTKFDRKVYYLLLGLVPYLAVMYVIGGFTETRLLHPLIVTLIIGVFSSYKDTDIHDFVDSELSFKP